MVEGLSNCPVSLYLDAHALARLEGFTSTFLHSARRFERLVGANGFANQFVREEVDWRIKMFNDNASGLKVACQVLRGGQDVTVFPLPRSGGKVTGCEIIAGDVTTWNLTMGGINWVLYSILDYPPARSFDHLLFDRTMLALVERREVILKPGAEKVRVEGDAVLSSHIDDLIKRGFPRELF